jgi:hypothetical protein
MKKFAWAFIAILTIASCKKSEKANKMIAVDWMLGTWENDIEQGKLTETWEKANDSTLNGKSYFIKDKDTLNNETVMLMQKGNDLFYIPTVIGQNNNEPVIFKLTKGTATQLVFENPKHDFPQKITYRQITKDSILAEISGIENGKAASETYPMKRKQ